MALGNFYPAPEPVQQIPKALPRTGGDQPPRTAALSVVSMLAILAPQPDWPAQSAPRIVAQTLVYGQQPPRIAAEAPTMPAILAPQPDWPAQRGPRITPLTLPRGDEPPRKPLPLAYQPPVDWSAQEGEQILPLTLPTGQQPPRIPEPLAFQPQPDWPAQFKPPIAPMTLIYGQQPPRIAGLTVLSTPALDWLAQRVGPIPIVPFVAPPYQPFRRDPVDQSVASDWIVRFPVSIVTITLPTGQRPAVPLPLAFQPQPDWSAQHGAQIATLTLPTGQQPPARLFQPLIVPGLDWPAQSASPPAAIVPPPVVSTTVAYRRDGVPWPSWDWNAQAPARIVALTLPTGQQPPPGRAILQPAEAASWPAQRATPSAAWNVVVVQTKRPYFRAPVPWVDVDWTTRTAGRIASLIVIVQTGQHGYWIQPGTDPIAGQAQTSGVASSSGAAPVGGNAGTAGIGNTNTGTAGVPGD